MEWGSESDSVYVDKERMMAVWSRVQIYISDYPKDGASI